MDPKSDYLTQIASIQERIGDRSINLDDLDPGRRNARVVPLMAIDRMKQNILAKSLSVSVESGTWVREDLAGTKNGSNATFTITNTPELATLIVVHNNAFVTRVTGTALTGEYSISTATITMGLTPFASDSLWAVYRIA